MKKIAFIRPDMFGGKSKDAIYPLIFAIVKHITPPDFQIEFYDEKVEDIPDTIDVDIVAITVDTFSAKRSYELSKKFKAQGKKIIMGGFHVTACPDEALQHSDSIIIGEIENIWPTVLTDIKNNNLKSQYSCNIPVDLEKIELDLSVYNNKKYKPIGVVQFSRGCKFACEFCSVHSFFKDSIRTKSIPKITEEINKIKNKYLFFIDDNLFSNKERSIALFNALIPLKKHWCCQISIDVAKDINLLKLMKRSGCFMVIIGFESLDVNNLKQMGKGINIKNQNYDYIVDNIYKAGLMIYGTFVIGYDFDTKDTALTLCDFAMKHKFAIANFNPLMPMPDTKLYDRLKTENRLTFSKWWLDDNYQYGDAMIKPMNMTEKELVESCWFARRKFNSFGNILNRMFNLRANSRNFINLCFFLVANITSRFEIHKKQGRKLGV